MEKWLCINFELDLKDYYKDLAIQHARFNNAAVEFREWVDMDTYKDWVEKENFEVVYFDIYDFDYLEDVYVFICISDAARISSLYCLETHFELLDTNTSVPSVINFLTNGGI